MSDESLSRNFSRHEFACRGINCCGHSAPISRELVVALQFLRDKVESPLHLNSGFRCLTHNREEGRPDTSQHALGMAADVRTPYSMTADAFYAMADSIPAFQGIGRYDWGLHVDVRNATHARWDERLRSLMPSGHPASTC